MSTDKLSPSIESYASSIADPLVKESNDKIAVLAISMHGMDDVGYGENEVSIRGIEIFILSICYSRAIGLPYTTIEPTPRNYLELLGSMRHEYDTHNLSEALEISLSKEDNDETPHIMKTIFNDIDKEGYIPAIADEIKRKYEQLVTSNMGKKKRSRTHQKYFTIEETFYETAGIYWLSSYQSGDLLMDKCIREMIRQDREQVNSFSIDSLNRLNIINVPTYRNLMAMFEEGISSEEYSPYTAQLNADLIKLKTVFKHFLYVVLPTSRDGIPIRDEKRKKRVCLSQLFSYNDYQMHLDAIGRDGMQLNLNLNGRSFPVTLITEDALDELKDSGRNTGINYQTNYIAKFSRISSTDIKHFIGYSGYTGCVVEEQSCSSTESYDQSVSRRTRDLSQASIRKAKHVHDKIQHLRRGGGRKKRTRKNLRNRSNKTNKNYRGYSKRHIMKRANRRTRQIFIL